MARLGFDPSTILEPTCGSGAFLAAAASAFPGRTLVGYDIDPAHVEAARSALSGLPATIEVGDFFSLPWEDILGGFSERILVLGNPPWVTSAGIGVIGGVNVPPKSNFKREFGLDARTGKSNFDVSEWMLLRLLELLRGRAFVMAVLCKASVARRVMERDAKRGWSLFGATFRIDAKSHFDAAVDAVLLVVSNEPLSFGSPRGWAVFDSLDAEAPSRIMGVVDQRPASDIERFAETRHLEGNCVPVWRSGLKHDCASVMELAREGGALRNRLGEIVDVEPEVVFPLLKGSDVANLRQPGKRAIIVPQRALGEDTLTLRERAPKAWAYLESHRARLDARKSSIYRDRSPFSIFGVGEYTWCPYKIAICGLYKRIRFAWIEPFEGSPVVLDDTCYFLPFENREEGLAAFRALSSEQAQSFLSSRVFWDEKRPIGKALLQSISLGELVREKEGEREAADPLSEKSDSALDDSRRTA